MSPLGALKKSVGERNWVVANASRFTARDVVMLLAERGGDDLPLSSEEQLDCQLEYFKDCLEDLEKSILGAGGVRGILVAEDQDGRKCYLSSLGKVFVLVDSDVFDVTTREAVDRFGIVPITEGLTASVVARLDEYQQVDALWDKLYQEVSTRFTRPAR